MLKSLSALAILTYVIVLTGLAFAQQCPQATIGVYFDDVGGLQSIQPFQHQELFMYVILFAEAPIGGAAWKLEMTSQQYTDPLIGPPGPNCQPPWCSYQDPPYWYFGSIIEGAVQLGDPFDTGVRQGFGTCVSGFFGYPVLLATVILYPWADILSWIEADVTVVQEDYEGLVYADCSARICDNVVGLSSHIGTTVIEASAQSWGSLKALYR
jgi:hypothetical protein